MRSTRGRSWRRDDAADDARKTQGAVIAGAAFSRDLRYRYRLWRRWSAAPVVGFCMLNPSTADAARDDPTIRRCIGFARTWGYGGVEIVNLFALRATDPRELRRARDPVGVRNDSALVDALKRVSAMVVAWGARGDVRGRDAEVLRLFAGMPLLSLGATMAGRPRHPLYLRRDLTPSVFAGPAGAI